MCILNDSIALALMDNILSSSPTFNVVDTDKVRIYCYMYEISHLWTFATSTIIQRFNYYQKLILETQFMHYVLPTISETHFDRNTQKNKWDIQKP